jgi:hypothetical protein
MLVYYCYRQKRDNPNDAFGCKNKDIKMPMVCDKRLSFIGKPSPSSAALAFIKMKWENCVRLF